MFSRTMFAAALAISLGGCAARSNSDAVSAPSRANAEPLYACATPLIDVPAEACEDLPEGYGASADLALEWGKDAANGVYDVPSKLFFGRLLCPNGTMALGYRAGIFGSNVQSASPASGAPSLGPPDIIDRWTVDCGETTFTIFVNKYRCGRPCAPPPLRLVPAGAAEGVIASRNAQKQGDLEAALHHALAAVAAFPGSEDIQSRLVSVLREMNRPADAAEQAAAGLREVPSSNWLRYLRANALAEASAPAEAAGVLDEILARLQPEEKRFRAAALCMRGTLARTLGDGDKGDEMIWESCALGNEECCEQ